MIGGINGYGTGIGRYSFANVPVDRITKVGAYDEENMSDAQIRAAKRAGKIECSTCAERAYKDGSDEMVSFKSPGHISPSASAATVRAHEQEHVSNAYKKAAMEDGEVVSTGVTLKTSTCPECGRSFVAGGETTTQIKYHEDNPYSKAAKSADYGSLVGMNFDAAV